ncbi:NAD(P)/FAD-dependent oxidoreductase [Marinomonas agarivorans]|nr:NAD(P)/FAD-dependent oxidoreductase [Marinomonas agarivorans]
MSDNNKNTSQICVIIGASHAGVNAAFALRKEGWKGEIILYDADPTLPYHRPPLSKAYLTSNDDIEQNAIKSAQSYIKDNITLQLGHQVTSITPSESCVVLKNGAQQHYDKLIIATGARPFIPPIQGLQTAKHVYPLRTAADVTHIKSAFAEQDQKRVVVIGGGYIGLETAASIKKLGGDVTVLEREERILARVTAPVMSDFFQSLHANNGVDVFTSKDVTSIKPENTHNKVICADGTEYEADIIIVGVGIRVNLELAEAAGLHIDNGIRVDHCTQTSMDNIYAIGDCSNHYNPHYDRYIRLESVQNAVDQAKTAAAAICGKSPVYNTIPWFWSDQYDVKLQMVGLSTGYNQIIVRHETDATKFSVWYFQDETLLSVDAINNAKAYVIGTKFIKDNTKVDKTKLLDSDIELKADNLKLDNS